MSKNLEDGSKRKSRAHSKKKLKSSLFLVNCFLQKFEMTTLLSDALGGGKVIFLKWGPSAPMGPLKNRARPPPFFRDAMMSK